MDVAWDLHYDRRVFESFLAHFLEGGVAHSLVEYARFAPYAVDLQMRHNPKTNADHVTLYVGLTSVLDVKTGKKGLHLVGHKTATGGLYGFDDAWTMAPELMSLSKITDQDVFNAPAVQKGVRAKNPPHVWYSAYQEGKIRNFHENYERALGIADETSD